MKTDRTKELLEQFKRDGIVHSSCGLKPIIEYQDCIGHSTPEELSEFEASLDRSERQHFFWVNAHTLSMDTFLDILKRTYIRRVLDNAFEAEYENEMAAREHVRQVTEREKS